MSSSSSLELIDLSFQYHKEYDWLFRNLTFQFEKGSITAITGPNGSGKTTLLYTICGIIPLLFKGNLQGQVNYSDKDISKYSLPQLSKWMNILLQDPNYQLVFPIVEQEIAFGAENLCLPVSQIEKRICRNLNLLGIEDLRFAHTAELSYGQKKMVSLASLLVMESQILILDEPSAGLDEYACELLKTLLLNLSAEGRIIIFADHNSELVQIAHHRITMPYFLNKVDTDDL